MDTTDTDHQVTIPLSDLPDSITGYLAAHQARDLDAAMRRYAADAAVTDEGRTYIGHNEIRAWLARAASEYTYTIELVSAARSGMTVSTPCTTSKATSPAASPTCTSASPCATA